MIPVIIQIEYAYYLWSKMKRIVSILLVFMLVFQTFNQLYFLVYYQVNKKFIAEVLCINKNRPELHCNGKCYLAQKLKDSTTNTEDGEEKVVVNVSRLEFILTSNPVMGVANTLDIYNTPASQNLRPTELYSRQFKPPIQA